MTLAVEDASSKLLVVPNVEVGVRESADDGLTTADGFTAAIFSLAADCLWQCLKPPSP